MKKGIAKRIYVFFIILIIIVTTTIIISINIIKSKSEQDSKSNLEVEVNPNVKPETNQSISGVENVEEINGKKVNTSNKLKETKIIESYIFSNINISRENTGTIITAVITSTTNEKISGRNAIIKFYNNSGKLVSQMDTYIPQIKPGKSVTFRTETTSDVTNAYDFDIELK